MTFWLVNIACVTDKRLMLGWDQKEIKFDLFSLVPLKRISVSISFHDAWIMLPGSDYTFAQTNFNFLHVYDNILHQISMIVLMDAFRSAS